MTTDFTCLSCGWTGTPRQAIWVYRTGPGNSGFACPECYAPFRDWRAELEEQWPQMPLGLEGVDRFQDKFGPATGAESP